MDKLHVMADGLMKYETLDVQQIKEIMEGKAPSPPEDWIEDSAAVETDEKKPEKEEKSSKSSREKVTIKSDNRTLTESE